MSNKKIHIAMSIGLIILFTTSLIAFILTCTVNDTYNICGYILSISIPFFFICLVIYVAIIEYRNKIKFNTAEILYINKCIEEFLDNKSFCKICKNYAKSNDLPIMIMEYAFMPYSYISTTQNFKLNKFKIDDYNTNYLKQVRVCRQEDLDQNRLAVQYAFEYSGKESDLKMNIKSFQSGCKFEVFSSSDENRNQFSEMNKLYLSLINQKVIDVPTDRNHYLAFLYLLYIYRKEHFFKEAKARVENVGLSINEKSNLMIEKLYDNDYEIGLIATTLYSLYSYENKYIDMSSFHYPRIEEITTRVVNEIKEKRKIENLLKGNKTKKSKFSVEDLDLMSGAEFENFITYMFNQLGYKATNTKLSGDQGIDVIATKRNTKIAIQCKCFHGTVGNHAIMEAYAGAKYYNADKCMVVTNSTFTKSARELANKNGVVLWDRQVLKEKLEEI